MTDQCTAMWSDDKGNLHRCILPGDHDGLHRMWARGWRGGLTTKEFQ